jgi:hypothetical protein
MSRTDGERVCVREGQHPVGTMVVDNRLLPPFAKTEFLWNQQRGVVRSAQGMLSHDDGLWCGDGRRTHLPGARIAWARTGRSS